MPVGGSWFRLLVFAILWKMIVGRGAGKGNFCSTNHQVSDMHFCGSAFIGVERPEIGGFL
jgi:hypothetical protein